MKRILSPTITSGERLRFLSARRHKINSDCAYTRYVACVYIYVYRLALLLLHSSFINNIDCFRLVLNVEFTVQVLSMLQCKSGEDLI